MLSAINAINFPNLIHEINFDKIEIKSGNGLRINLVDGYNDSKCTQQFSELRKSFNKSELWALKGEAEYFLMKHGLDYV